MGIQESNINNSVLFVGNGIDLLAGYKTDYPSFLEHYNEHYSAVIKKYVSKKVNDLNYSTFAGTSIFVENFKVIDDVLYGTNGYINTLINRNLLYGSGQSPQDKQLFYRELFVDEILGSRYLINSKFITKEDVVVNKPNTWITYFISIYLLNKSRGKNWIDLEELIKDNALKESKLSYTYEKHVRDMYGDVIDFSKRKVDDFYKMKVHLLEYLKLEKKKEINKIGLTSNDLWGYNIFLNFNYDDTYCLPHESTIQDKVYIHGNKLSENGRKIVFGYDDGLTKDPITFKPLVKQNSKTYSKTSQLLELATYNSENGIRTFRLPEKSSIAKIGILGHGIGEADYNYFETLADFDKVIIEVYWYYYRDEDGNKTKSNNKEALNKAVINMVHEMETRYKKVLLHKMIIEQRIIFKELEYNVIGEEEIE